MFSSKGVNRKIDGTHEKTSRLIVNDHKSTLDKMVDTLTHLFTMHPFSTP